MDFLTNPFVVVLLFLYQLVGGSLGLAIIVFTIIVRFATLPLTRAQLKSAKKMQELQPELTALRAQYKGDREKLAQAQMTLYRQSGVNPAAGCLPLLVQMPILFGLYGAIYAALGTTPLQLFDLNSRLMVPSFVSLVPLNSRFLWLNLGDPDPLFIMVILVVATTWLQSKLMTPPVMDPKDPSAAITRQMTTIMPIMVGLFSLSFASGLSLYWVVGNLVTIAQYMMLGKADLRNLFSRAPQPAAAAPALTPSPAPTATATTPEKKKVVSPAKPLSSGGVPNGGSKPKPTTTTTANSGIERKQKPGGAKATSARKPKPSKAK